jgi:hypothetical protein
MARSLGAANASHGDDRNYRPAVSLEQDVDGPGRGGWQ